MTALAVDMENEQDLDQVNQEQRTHINRFLLRLSNEPAFALAVIAVMANGGRGKIELTYATGGRLEAVDTRIRRQAGG
jgi:hypothetical protein